MAFSVLNKSEGERIKLQTDSSINNLDIKPIKSTGSEFTVNRTRFSSDLQHQNIFHVNFLKDTFSDFARPNLYKIVFNISESSMGTKNFQISDKVITEQSAKSITIPNFEITKKVIKRMGYTFNVPSVRNFPDVTCSFTCDSDYTSRKFFHKWMELTSYNTNSNTYSNNMLESSIDIFQLDNKFDVVFGVKLHNAWPSSIGEVQLSFESDSQIVEYPVNFTYSTYDIFEIV